jgi:hypothetical protein
MIASSTISRPAVSRARPLATTHARMDRSKLRGREGHCACTLRKTGNEARKPGRSDRNANNRRSETGGRQRYPRECRGFSHTGK